MKIYNAYHISMGSNCITNKELFSQVRMKWQVYMYIKEMTEMESEEIMDRRWCLCTNNASTILGFISMPIWRIPYETFSLFHKYYLYRWDVITITQLISRARANINMKCGGSQNDNIYTRVKYTSYIMSLPAVFLTAIYWKQPRSVYFITLPS